MRSAEKDVIGFMALIFSIMASGVAAVVIVGAQSSLAIGIFSVMA